MGAQSRQALLRGDAERGVRGFPATKISWRVSVAQRSLAMSWSVSSAERPTACLTISDSNRRERRADFSPGTISDAWLFGYRRKSSPKFKRKLFPLHTVVLDCRAQAIECAKKRILLNRPQFALDFGPEQSMHGGHGTPSLTGSLL